MWVRRGKKGRKKARLKKVQPGMRAKIPDIWMCMAKLADTITYRTGINMTMKLYMKKTVWFLLVVFISTSA